ncbi:hypothetical protein EV670_3549 [Rivibacter subsaxonicus]|uniref:Uncharacterized protein n=1 Tax=Rivibacter subsaxonicus TaxID=457575 RepID=A0A4Q7V7E6_9BURK|nr:hypothetical protein EV670_3549 [Rivibacter subsaxonicus]
MGIPASANHREPWNKGKLVGQKAPFKLKDIWALRALDPEGPEEMFEAFTKRGLFRGLLRTRL